MKMQRRNKLKALFVCLFISLTMAQPPFAEEDTDPFKSINDDFQDKSSSKTPSNQITERFPWLKNGPSSKTSSSSMFQQAQALLHSSPFSFSTKQQSSSTPSFNNNPTPSNNPPFPSNNQPIPFANFETHMKSPFFPSSAFPQYPNPPYPALSSGFPSSFSSLSPQKAAHPNADAKVVIPQIPQLKGNDFTDNNPSTQVSGSQASSFVMTHSTPQGSVTVKGSAKNPINAKGLAQDVNKVVSGAFGPSPFYGASVFPLNPFFPFPPPPFDNFRSPFPTSDRFPTPFAKRVPAAEEESSQDIKSGPLGFLISALMNSQGGPAIVRIVSAPQMDSQNGGRAEVSVNFSPNLQKDKIQQAHKSAPESKMEDKKQQQAIKSFESPKSAPSPQPPSQSGSIAIPLQDSKTTPMNNPQSLLFAPVAPAILNPPLSSLPSTTSLPLSTPIVTPIVTPTTAAPQTPTSTPVTFIPTSTQTLLATPMTSTSTNGQPTKVQKGLVSSLLDMFSSFFSTSQHNRLLTSY